MTISIINNVKVSGMCTALPNNKVDNLSLAEYFADQDLSKIVESTGIHARHVVKQGQTALSLGERACSELLNKTNTDVEDIGVVIFVTQTPDYPLPGNAVQLQHLLKLPKKCAAFDVNLGCSGYVYGLWQCASLLNSVNASKALLVVGDTSSTQYAPDNTKVNTLFGDAVSAVLLEKGSNANDMVFDLGSDGAGAPYLIQKNGGAKHPATAPDLTMDGTQVFAFTLREIPRSVKRVLDAIEWQVEQIDHVVLHQANTMMLKHLGDKLKCREDQVVLALENCGNTSSASIPLAMCLAIPESLSDKPNKLLLSGFGVGWSWATAVFEQAPLEACFVVFD